MNPIRHLAGLILLSQGVQSITRYFNTGFLVAIAVNVAKAIAERTDNFDDAEIVASIFALEHGGRLNELTDETIASRVDSSVKQAESSQYSQWYAEIDAVIRSDADVEKQVAGDAEEANTEVVEEKTVEPKTDALVENVKKEEPKADEVKTDEPQSLKDVAITDLAIPATVRKVLEAAGLTTARAVLAYDVNPENDGGLNALGNFDDVRRNKTLAAIEKALS
jgi:hypothetical protein